MQKLWPKWVPVTFTEISMTHLSMKDQTSLTKTYTHTVMAMPSKLYSPLDKWSLFEAWWSWLGIQTRRRLRWTLTFMKTLSKRSARLTAHRLAITTTSWTGKVQSSTATMCQQRKSEYNVAVPFALTSFKSGWFEFGQRQLSQQVELLTSRVAQQSYHHTELKAWSR